MKVNVTGFLLSPLSVVSKMVMWERGSGLQRIFLGVVVRRTAEKHG